MGEQNEKLTAETLTEELYVAIGRLKVNNSPGMDGLTFEWYSSPSDVSGQEYLATGVVS